MTWCDFCEATETCVYYKTNTVDREKNRLEKNVTIPFMLWLFVLFQFDDDGVYYVDYLIKYWAETLNKNISFFSTLASRSCYICRTHTHLTNASFVLAHTTCDIFLACSPANLKKAINSASTLKKKKEVKHNGPQMAFWLPGSSRCEAAESDTLKYCGPESTLQLRSSRYQPENQS